MSRVVQTASSQSSTPPIGSFVRYAVMTLSAVLFPSTSDARAQGVTLGSVSSSTSGPVLSMESPLGPIVYHAGRGVRFDRFGLTIGGFTTVEIDREEGDTTVYELDGVNFLINFEPTDFLHFFSEVEIGDIFTYEAASDDVDSDVVVDIERLYVDLVRSDALNLRVGKFLTPIGRWNLVPAEPFTWTASEPILVERAFDDTQTGVALHGTTYPGGDTLRYWLYGQVFDPLDPSEDPVPAERSAGGRIEYGGPLDRWSVGASLLASEQKNEWNYLAGLDAVARMGALELTVEGVFAEGGIPDRDLWGVYLQGVYHLGAHHRFLRGFHLVARYEHFDPDGKSEDTDLWDVGLTWIPKPWLILKGGYRFADRDVDDATDGLFTSISVLF